MSNRPARPALHRIGAVGHGQDDAGRAAGAGAAESADVAVLHVARGARTASATASTIISSAVTRSSSASTDCEFLEWADVFGNYYGTCAADVERLIADGRMWCW